MGEGRSYNFLESYIIIYVVVWGANSLCSCVCIYSYGQFSATWQLVWRFLVFSQFWSVLASCSSRTSFSLK